MKANKKIVSLILSATLLSASMVGCGSLDNTATVLTVGSEEVSAGVANFYARYLQAMEESYYMSYYGEDMWSVAYSDDLTYQDQMKTNIMDALKELYVVRQHAEELEVSISEEELEAITLAADEFMAANTNEEYNELASINKENVVELLSLLTLQKKAEAVIKLDVDTDTSEEDTIQKKMTVTGYGFTYEDESGETVTFTEEEKAQMYSNLEGLKSLTSDDLLTNATAIEASTEEITFDEYTTTVDAQVIEIANELELNEYSEVIETADGYYLIQLTSLFDEEATDAKIAEIIAQREVDLYMETVELWLEEITVTVEDSVWDKVDFETLGINLPGVSTDSDSGITTYENTYEFGSDIDSEETETETETTEE